jgi:hypothetical protein
MPFGLVGFAAFSGESTLHSKPAVEQPKRGGYRMNLQFESHVSATSLLELCRSLVTSSTTRPATSAAVAGHFRRHRCTGGEECASDCKHDDVPRCLAQHAGKPDRVGES